MDLGWRLVMSRLEELIRLENHHRRLAQSYERKSEYHWNLANKYLLQIQGEAENERELANSELTNSQGV